MSGRSAGDQARQARDQRVDVLVGRGDGAGRLRRRLPAESGGEEAVGMREERIAGAEEGRKKRAHHRGEGELLEADYLRQREIRLRLCRLGPRRRVLCAAFQGASLRDGGPTT